MLFVGRNLEEYTHQKKKKLKTFTYFSTNKNLIQNVFADTPLCLPDSASKEYQLTLAAVHNFNQFLMLVCKTRQKHRFQARYFALSIISKKSLRTHL